MKKYQNGMYDDLIEARVRAMKFQNEFKPFVIDILKRRAYQYDFTHKQVTLDLDRLAKSLYLFSIDKKAAGIGGVFYEDEKRIEINLNKMPGYTELYNIFTHELYHALAMENGVDTMAGINKYSMEYNDSLLEVLVEKASFRTINPVNTSNPYYNENCQGYNRICFASEMICATFGITEQELLGNSIQGRDGLVDFLAEKVHSDKEGIKDFLDEFEMNLAVIHNSLYNFEDKKDNKHTKWENIAEALGGMKKSCASRMLLDFENIPKEELSEKRFDDLKFNFNKLNKVIQLGTKHITKNKKALLKRVDDISSELMGDYANGLLQTQYLLEFEKTHSLPEEFEMFKNWARNGLLENYDILVSNGGQYGPTLSDFGLVLPKKVTPDKTFKIPKEAIIRNREPIEKTDEWDNTFIRKHNLKRVINKMKYREKWAEIKKYLFGIKVEKLAPAKSVSTSSVKNVDNPKEVVSNFSFKQEEHNTTIPSDTRRSRIKSNRENKSNDYDER